jgi:hypothetical protein
LVPTCHLGRLAERIDRASSAFAEQQVIQFHTIQPPNSKGCIAAKGAPVR